MQRFRNILVLYQGWVGDEATLDRAIVLARDNGADLTLATAVKPPRAPMLAPLAPTPPGTPTPYASLVKERQRHLRRLAAGIRPGNFRIHCQVLAGRPEEEIIRLAREKRIDLVMMTANHESVLGTRTAGNLAVRCMHHAPCPVWVSHPVWHCDVNRVVAAVDLDGPEATPSPLDTQILETAATLARQRNGHLDILHAWELRGADLETIRSETTHDIRERLLRRASSACTRAMAQLCTAVDLDGVKTEVHLLRGAAADTIARFANHRQVDLIVMGIGRTGLAAFLFGNPAEHVLERAWASVLTIKRPDPASLRQNSLRQWNPPRMAAAP